MILSHDPLRYAVVLTVFLSYRPLSTFPAPPFEEGRLRLPSRGRPFFFPKLVQFCQAKVVDGSKLTLRCGGPMRSERWSRENTPASGAFGYPLTGGEFARLR